ncbi:sarcosine oxidase (plasmid) [Acinetobacter sp. NCu2D-2]|uniref:sarcosine oxidase subunit gamma n=1 Tax=Acinetobacter sp. NCu2D-2 TaxID=1608473 RepID=UPI0007CDB6C2|nr:sarcosine oxidase [Acinetobacter sp. NCu2D-2]ANF83413.1 sarcosine oxidase [Acinetobacter sp. NCu2D-2]
MQHLYAAERSLIQQTFEQYDSYGAGKQFLTTPNQDTQLKQCGLIDLTHLSRVGFRGTEASSYLNQQGFSTPERPNTLFVQADGSVVGRLSATEYLLLGSLQDFGEGVATLEANWSMQNDASNYLLPRQDSHAWLMLTGETIALVMAKLCGVDLSDNAFKPGQIAQTSIARVNAIILNVGDAESPKFSILCDRSASLYLWDVLIDAIQEFDGKVLGINTLL